MNSHHLHDNSNIDSVVTKDFVSVYVFICTTYLGFQV